MAWRSLVLHAALVVATGASALAQRAQVHSFEGPPAGVLPPGFTLAAWRQPAPGPWTVDRVGSTLALHHAPDTAADGWAIALTPDAAMNDSLVSARLRLSGGTRAGGVVWRYVDDRNFHAAVLDLRRGELAAYRVVDGNRVRFDDRDDLELDPDAWHVLKVVHEDGRVLVSLGGIRVLEERERQSPRLAGGRVGVLAHGAADAWFDDLRVERREAR